MQTNAEADKNVKEEVDLRQQKLTINLHRW